MGSDDHQKFVSGAEGKKIMVAAIFSLGAVFLLILLLHLYSRFLQRHQERRRRAALDRLRRQIVPDLDLVTNSSEPPQQLAEPGLDPSLIALLPKFTYKVPRHLAHDDQSQTEECTICLANMAEGVTVRMLPNCKHMFHAQCIDMWLGSHTTCPVCRSKVEPRVLLPEQEAIGGGVQVQPSAPPLEKASESSGSRLGSFRWMMLGRDRSSRTQSYGDEVGIEDPERR